jgi:hypothetical protein
VIEGQRVVIRPADIARLQRTAARMEKMSVEDMAGCFDVEIQKAIIANLGDKLKNGLLKIQELGFKFSARDSDHAHLLVDRAVWESIKEKYPDASQENISKKELISLTKEVKALIFHCAEVPTPEQIVDEKFLREVYPHRSIVVDEYGHAFDAKPKFTEPLPEGRLPEFGMMAKDYNALKGTDYRDLAVDFRNVMEYGTDVEFRLASEEDGAVTLDPQLPSLKFFLPGGYRKETPETKK